ncbi:MAG: SpoIIE family protein phosphatase [Fidelibacterota bacterium]|nr:MAG: SpoIIE family protein phosphatase [Candidatus Neomarinimicrobiota bacterium]
MQRNNIQEAMSLKMASDKTPYREESFSFGAGEFGKYMDSLIHEWLKTMMTVAFTLVPLFFILDFFTMPRELLPRFGVYRLVATVVLLLQYFSIRHSRPGLVSYLHAYFASIIVGGTIALMTVDLGGFDCRYYAGLNLVIIAVNIPMPWKAIYSTINSIIIISLYILLNIISGQTFSPSVLTNNLFFLCSTAVFAVAINHLRYKLIEKEFYLMIKLQKARDALWSEMELAKRIQTALLPENKRIKGFEIAATMFPAIEVGGDYYDIIETESGDRWVTIGDVSGHGVDAGLIMMMAETSIISMVNSLNDASPSAVIESVNGVIRENISRLGSDHYMTLMAIRVNGSKMTMAGKHQDIIVYRAKQNRTEVIPTNGTWLGISDNIGKYLEDKAVNFSAGDIILLFTDGITEATNQEGEMYGQVRLEQAFNQYADLPIGKLMNKIIREVDSFQAEQLDDMTLIVMKKLPD